MRRSGSAIGLVFLATPLAPAPQPLFGQDGAADSTRSWTAEVGISLWLPQDESNFLLLQASADRGPLHLELRYNYESLETGSAWIGWTLEGGGSVTFFATPMVGVLAGETRGVAPGLELGAGVGPVDVYGEAEWVVEAGDDAEDFFYLWSEIGVRPIAPLRLGIAAQRTRVVDTPRDLARGPFASVELGRAGLTGCWLDPDRDGGLWILTIGVSF
jgi:hypothetical protein